MANNCRGGTLFDNMSIIFRKGEDEIVDSGFCLQTIRYFGHKVGKLSLLPLEINMLSSTNLSAPKRRDYLI